MSKYEDEILANMKNCVILIIFYTNFAFCTHLNTSDDLYPTCPVTLFRRKRELMEYTRWRADLEPSPEFIVKILDDDLTTPNTRKIIGVNVQPPIKGGEKIIIGGAMIPKPTTSTQLPEKTKDYTRFVPPTTVITRDRELYIAPIPPIPDILANKILPIEPRGRHSQRDESPPAAPQFLPRTQAAAWQYPAPITPVGFNRRTTMPPITPAPLRYTNPTPTRTSPLDSVIVPFRTKSEYDEFRRYQHFEDDSDLFKTNKFATRSSFAPHSDPQRSSYDFETTQANEYVGFLPPKERNFIIDNKLLEDKKTAIVDMIDSSYNMMFYNYDENENFSNKVEKETDDNMKDTTENQKDTEASEDMTETKDLSKSNVLSTSHYEKEEESNNVTSKITTTLKSTKIEIVTQYFNEMLRDKRRPVCSLLKLRQLNFNSPLNLPEIVAQLKKWDEDSPVAKWVDITDGNFTVMENPIHMMIVDDPSSGQIVTAKQTVMIVAGIQGRDHHAVAAAMYVLYQLIERSESHADLLTKYRFWVIPVFNPDGYDYSMTFPHRREWTRNLRQNWDECKGRDSCRSCEAYGIGCTVQPCYGVNLDRNFEYQWISPEELRAEHACGSLYAGSRQLSEAETRALTEFLHKQLTPILTFIAFKEGGVLGIMYPYSHTKKKRAFDNVYRQRASRASAAAFSISGRHYVAGQTSEFFPLYAGGIEDWVYSHLGVDNTYTIVMFRPSDTLNSKLNIERVVHEAYAAMDTLVLQSMEAQAPPSGLVTAMRAKGAAYMPSPPNLLAFILPLFVINIDI